MDERLKWLDAKPTRPEGCVVHTLLDGQPVKVTKVDGEWVAESEEWKHDRS